MKRTSKRLNALIGAATGLGIATLLWFIELQSSDFKLFFTTFTLTGAVSAVVTGEVNRRLVRPPMSLEEREIYAAIGEVRGKYSTGSQYDQQVLVALNEVKLLLEDKKL